MAKNGLTEPDTSAYGFYTVRLKESLRPAPTVDSNPAVVDSLMKQNGDDDQTGVVPVPATDPEPEPEKKPGFFKRLFGGGKKDSTKTETVDTAAINKKREKDEKRNKSD
jgi:hypothetical protein